MEPSAAAVAPSQFVDLKPHHEFRFEVAIGTTVKVLVWWSASVSKDGSNIDFSWFLALPSLLAMKSLRIRNTSSLE